MSEAFEVVCVRTYAFPVGLVFRAFTEPALMRRWWSPDAAVAVDVLTWDLERGGRWRFAYRFPEGRVVHVGGAFRTVEVNRRLVFTWTWEPPDVHAGTDTLVSLTFDAVPEGTTVRVRHERFPDQAARDRHDAGWASTLDRLPEVLS